jgi:hypothetical protein
MPIQMFNWMSRPEAAFQANAAAAGVRAGLDDAGDERHRNLAALPYCAATSSGKWLRPLHS